MNTPKGKCLIQKGLNHESDRTNQVPNLAGPITSEKGKGTVHPDTLTKLTCNDFSSYPLNFSAEEDDVMMIPVTVVSVAIMTSERRSQG